MTDTALAPAPTPPTNDEPGIVHECCGKDVWVGWCGTKIETLDPGSDDQECIVCDGLQYTSVCPVSNKCECRG